MVQHNSFSRRRLLQSTAALAVPTIVPASVLAKDPASAPSEKVTVGLIGCGKMANDYHLPQLLKQPDVRIGDDRASGQPGILAAAAAQVGPATVEICRRRRQRLTGSLPP